LSLAQVVSNVSDRVIPRRDLDRSEVVKINVYEASLLDEHADGIEIRGSYWRKGSDDGLPIRSTFRFAYETIPASVLYRGDPSKIVDCVHDACVSILRALLPDPLPLFRIGTRAKLRVRKRGQRSAQSQCG
jgi:hypothetical protein